MFTNFLYKPTRWVVGKLVFEANAIQLTSALVASCFVGVFAQIDASAQTLPDAGVLQPRSDREPATGISGKPLLGGPVVKLPAGTDDGLVFTVSRFRLEGNALITAEQFEAAVAPYVNRPLTFSELLIAVRAVASVYRQAGWVVSVGLPEQDITQGEVRIQVTNAVLGGIEVRGAEALGFGAGSVERYVTAQQSPLENVNTDAINRALYLLSDLPGVGVVGTLRAGNASGMTDLLLDLTPRSGQAADISLDNTGSRGTGYWRAAGNVSTAGLLTVGDQLSANFIHTFTEYQSDGSDYQRVAYSLPMGYNGLRLGVGGSLFSYRLVTPEFSAGGFEGDADSFDLELTYPLLRRGGRNVYLSGKAEQKHFKNRGANILVSSYSLEEQSVGLYANLLDGLAGGASNSASLVLSSGFLDLRDSPNQSSVAATTGAEGAFTRLRYSLMRDQSLGNGFSMFAALNGQTADKNLDSSAKFYLGGSNGVRAYPASEGSGYQGFVLNLEARWKPTANWQLAALYDYGYVTVNHNNNFSGAPTLNEYSLRGYGLSAAWSGQHNQTVAITWARRIGDNANATSDGNDQDGSYYRDRVWFNAKLAF